MFRWMIAGKILWSMSFDLGLASETRENCSFSSAAKPPRTVAGKVFCLYKKKTATLTDSGRLVYLIFIMKHKLFVSLEGSVFTLH